MKIIDIHLLKNKVVVHLLNQKLEINPNTYTEFNLYIHKDLTNKDLAKIKEFDAYCKDLNYALDLLNKYSYYTNKLKAKLVKRKVSDANQKKIIEYLNEKHLLDDRSFALEYATSLIYHHKGIDLIIHKLNSLGFKSEDIQYAINHLDKHLIQENLVKYIKTLNKRYTQSKVIDKTNKIKRACLISGYSLNDINGALSKINLTEIDYIGAIKNDYQKFKRQYDDPKKIINALKKKGYNYSKIKVVMEEDEHDFY